MKYKKKIKGPFGIWGKGKFEITEADINAGKGIWNEVKGFKKQVNGDENVKTFSQTVFDVFKVSLVLFFIGFITMILIPILKLKTTSIIILFALISSTSFFGIVAAISGLILFISYLLYRK